MADADQPSGGRPEFGAAPLRVAQIIVLAIFAGAAIFLGVVLTIAGGPAPSQQQLVPQRGLAAAALILLARFAFLVLFDRQAVAAASASGIPGRVRANFVDFARLTDDGQPSADALTLWPWFQQRLIVSVALLEGAVFFNLIAYMLFRQTANLVVACVPLLYILLHFPTIITYINWVRGIVDRAARFTRP